METSLSNKNINLRTRFYSNSYKEIKEVLIKIIKERFALIYSINDEYKEFFIHDYVYDVTITITEGNPMGIDLLVIAPLLYNKKKYINNFYNDLDKLLNRVGDE